MLPILRGVQLMVIDMDDLTLTVLLEIVQYQYINELNAPDPRD